MVVASAIFLFFLGIYALGVSATVFGGDSGEIILSYYFAGVAHPPGYPLNVMLGWILSRLPVEGTFAFRANLVSAIYSALSLSLLYLLFLRLARDKLLALVVALTLGFTTLFWLYAHVAEVFQLALVLILLSLIFLFDWLNLPVAKKPNFKLFNLAIFFAGLAVFHHQITLLLAPAYLYLIYKSRKLFTFKKKLLAFFFFFLGMVPYAFVFWATLHPTPVNWDNPTGLNSFLSLLTRADYGSFTATSGLVGMTLAARSLQILWWAKVVLADFTIIGVGLVLLGLANLFLNRRDIFWFFLIAVFFSGPFFLFYASFPPTITFLQGVIERFLLVNYLFMAILLGFGLLALRGILLGLFVKKSVMGRIVQLTLNLSFFLLPMTFALINWPKTDLSNYQIGKVFASDILAGADPSGVIFLQGDTATFNTEYQYYVESENSRAKLVLLGRLKRPAYRATFMRYNRDLVFDDVFRSGQLSDTDKPFISLIAANYGKLPFYAFEALPAPDGYIWVQEGMLKKLYKEGEVPGADELVQRISEKSQKIKYNPGIVEGQYLHLFADHIKTHYGSIYSQNGFELLRVAKFNEAEEYFKLAVLADSKNKSALFGLGAVYFEQKKCKESEDLFRQAQSLDADYWQALEGLSKVYGECFGDAAKRDEYLEKLRQVKEKLFQEPLN